MIIAVVEFVKIEFARSLCTPKTHCINSIIHVSRHRSIICHSYYLRRIRPSFSRFSIFITVFFNMSVKIYWKQKLRSCNLPRITVTQPAVRKLNLITILDYLMKYTEFITQSVTICRISKCCHRIQKTCG